MLTFPSIELFLALTKNNIFCSLENTKQTHLLTPWMQDFVTF